ncbi:MAG: pyrrolo-quinoline quinone [Bacillota bacterium]
MSQLKRRRRRRRPGLRFYVLLLLLLAAVVLGFLLFRDQIAPNDDNPITSGRPNQPGTTEGPTPVPTPTPVPAFSPTSISEDTSPQAFGLTTGLSVDGEQVDSYTRPDPIDFLEGVNYTKLEGIIGFRGNNFRSSAFYGVAKLSEKKFDTEPWTVKTGSLPKRTGEGSWTGSGWTGQPLIVKWPDATKQIMNMYDSAKNKEGLVEVIYATMDGHIYFLDLDTGEKTRDPINVGFPFKGAGALDPRGIPLMYVGAGDHTSTGGGQYARSFIVNLVTGKVDYTFGNSDDFALREGHISFFDSSALVDAETDTLIYPGENGVLYTMKLNTKYDESAGTLSIGPSEVVRWHYKTERSSTGSSSPYWLGIEDSAVVWRGCAIFTDNGGNMFCLDLNTYEVKWMQDTLDDTNCTPVLSLEGADHHPYIYTSTSFHGGWRAPVSSTATIPIWKIDAVTGEIVWKVEYDCRTVADVSGGVQGTLALGEQGLADLIFVPIARHPNTNDGVLVAIDKNTHEERWSFPMENYPWSSPVAIYDASGKGYIIQCNQAGDMFLLDGLTGVLLDTINLGGNIEASPAVYNNTIVVGTRLNEIYGITLE